MFLAFFRCQVCRTSDPHPQGIQGIQGTSQSMPADFTAMDTTPKDCVASTTKQLRFGLTSSKT